MTINKTNNIHNIKKRAIFIYGSLIACLVLVALRLIFLSTTQWQIAALKRTTEHNNSIINHEIVDRNNRVLAITIPSNSIYIKPNRIKQNERKIIQTVLVDVLHKSKAEADVVLGSGAKFMWLARGVDDNVVTQVKRYGVSSIFFKKTYKRYYPYGNIFSHVVGMSNVDGRGVSGLERSYHELLAKQRLETSLDYNMQASLHKELTLALKQHQANAAFAVILDIHTSEVLAMVSLPDFNPNDHSTVNSSNLFNYSTQGLFEEGSVFKPFNIAMALNEGIININDKVDVTQPLFIANKYLLSDFSYINYNYARQLSIPGILIYSSNIGSALIGSQVGVELQKHYLSRLGLLSISPIELPEVSRPIIPSRWNKVNVLTISYGYGISTSQINLANAYAALVNGGIYREPTLIKTNITSKGVRVLDKTVSSQMRAMLRLVTALGSGRKANISGYNIGGKTGSAEKVNHSSGVSYDANVQLASFVGVLPANKPRYIVAVAIDEPKRLAFNHYNITGGSVGSITFRKVIEAVFPNKEIFHIEDDNASLLGKNDAASQLDFINQYVLEGNNN